MSEKKACPYCGELIAPTAKKCRFCGEWLDQSENGDQDTSAALVPVAQPVEIVSSGTLQPTDPSAKVTLLLNSGGQDRATVVKLVKEYTGLNLFEAKNLVDSVPCVIGSGLSIQAASELKYILENAGAEVALVPERNSTTQASARPVSPGPHAGSQPPYQAPQPIVVNVVNNQSVEQNVAQEQTVIVENSKSSDNSSSSWITWELIAIGGLIWGVTGSWIWGLVAYIIGMTLYHIPYLGAALCYVLGAAWGLIIGGFSAAIFHSDAAGWIIGIIAAIGIGYGHYEAREKHIAD